MVKIEYKPFINVLDVSVWLLASAALGSMLACELLYSEVPDSVCQIAGGTTIHQPAVLRGATLIFKLSCYDHNIIYEQ